MDQISIEFDDYGRRYFLQNKYQVINCVYLKSGYLQFLEAGDFRRAFIVSEALAIGFPKPGIVNEYPAYEESYLRLKTEKCSICFSRIGENRAIYIMCLHTSCLDCTIRENTQKVDRLNEREDKTYSSRDGAHADTMPFLPAGIVSCEWTGRFPNSTLKG